MKLFYFIAIAILLSIYSCEKPRKVPRSNSSTSSSLHTTSKNREINNKPTQEIIHISKPDDEQNKEVLTGKQIFRKYNNAVFTIYTPTKSGSGFFIKSNGLAVSNHHVFEGEDINDIEIHLADGTVCKVTECIAYNENDDIYIFKVSTINNNFTYIPYLSTNSLEIGQIIYTIGSPKGLQNTLSSGEISQLRDGNYIQINAPIDHGSSGGALIDEYGYIIGITTSGYEESTANLNFAMDFKCVIKLLNQRDYQ